MNRFLKNALEELEKFYPDPEEILFLKDFPPVSREEWLQEIYKVLEKSGKPKDLSAISWKTPDGFTVPPFFRKEDLENLKYIQDYPGVYPFTRGKKFSQNWEILQYLQGNLEEVREKIEQTTRRGADGIILPAGETSFPFTFYGKAISISDIGKVQEYLKTFPFTTYFIGSTKDLLNCLNANGLTANYLIDPFLDFLIEEESPVYLEELVKIVKQEIQSHFSFLAIRSDIFHLAGVPPATELGLTLGALAEILYTFHREGIPVAEILPHIVLLQPSGSLYFLEIAKFRATRRLLAFLLQGFGISDYKEAPKQLAVNSLFHHSIYDIHNNILRSTVSAMGAILGGVDSLVILPMTAINQEDDEFTRRIAINTQLILKYESHFDYVTDPAGGSYYIENLTDMIIEKAWKVFLDIEEQGGFREALEKGYIQNQIKEIQTQRIENIKSRKEFLLGVNQFPNTGNFVLKEFPELNLIGKYNSNTSSKTISVFRAPIFFEELRIKTEELSRDSGVPVIQLLPFGNLAMQRARASFILNFFGCGGFQVNDPGDLKSTEEIINFVKGLDNPNIKAFVLCSSDAEYPDMFSRIRETLLEKNIPVIVAGLPENFQQLKETGIYDFIHIKSNIYEKLIEYQKLFFNLKS